MSSAKPLSCLAEMMITSHTTHRIQGMYVTRSRPQTLKTIMTTFVRATWPDKQNEPGLFAVVENVMAHKDYKSKRRVFVLLGRENTAQEKTHPLAPIGTYSRPQTVHLSSAMGDDKVGTINSGNPSSACASEAFWRASNTTSTSANRPQMMTYCREIIHCHVLACS